MAWRSSSAVQAGADGLRPGSVVPLEASRGPRASRPAVLLAVSVLLAALGTATVVVRDHPGQRVAAAGRPDPAFVDRDPGRDPVPTSTAMTGRTRPSPPPPASAPVVPTGYRVHHDADGYWVAAPNGWETRTAPTGERQWWGDVSRSDVKLLFVTVDAAPAKAPSAVAALAGHESVRKRGPTIFYRRIQLAEKPLIPGAASVADLEFTDRDYAEGAQTWHYHTLVRAVVTPDRRLFLLEFTILHDIYQDDGTTEGDWNLALPTVRTMLASFRPDAAR